MRMLLLMILVMVTMVIMVMMVTMVMIVMFMTKIYPLRSGSVCTSSILQALKIAAHLLDHLHGLQYERTTTAAMYIPET